MRHHDGWVQGFKIKRCDWGVVRSLLRFQDGRTFIWLFGKRSILDCGYHVSQFSSFFRQLRKDLDLLPSFDEETERNPCRFRHLQKVEKCTQFFQEFMRK